MIVAASKDEAVEVIADLIGVPVRALGPGKKEHKQVLLDVIDAFELPVERELSKPELGEAIATLAGVRWDPGCDSRSSPSGGGSTVSLIGLNRVIEAILVFRQRGVATPEPGESAETDERVGRPYVVSEVAVTAAPIGIELDWDALDRGTRAHASLQNALARFVAERGHTPLSPAPADPRFDLAWRGPRGLVVCEVKSSTVSNGSQQLRLALGQVLEYRFLLQRDLAEPVAAVIALEQPPPAAGHGYCASAGVVITTATSFDRDLHQLV